MRKRPRPQPVMDDSDSDSPPPPPRPGGRVIKQVQVPEDADPSVYGYDEVYDDIAAGRQQHLAKKAALGRDKRPRYMDSMIKAAQHRKVENDIAYNRTLIKETEEEDAPPPDEMFVTSGYKEKLKEHKEFLQKKAAEDAAVEQSSVSAGGMLAFHRALLNAGDAQTSVSKPAQQPSLSVQSARNDSARSPLRRTRRDEPVQASGYESPRDLSPVRRPSPSPRSIPSIDEESSGTPSVPIPRASSGDSSEPSGGLSKEEKLAQARARFLSRSKKVQ